MGGRMGSAPHNMGVPRGKEKRNMLPKTAERSFALIVVLMMLTASLSAKTRIEKRAFGHTPEGTPVELYSLKDGKIEVGIMTYGGIVLSLLGPDRNGKFYHMIPGCEHV